MLFSKPRTIAVSLIAALMVPLFAVMTLRLHGEPAFAAAVTDAPKGPPAMPAPVIASNQAPTTITDVDRLKGDWVKSDTKYTGQIRLTFGEGFGHLAGTKTLRIAWTPPNVEGAPIDLRNTQPNNNRQLGGMLGMLGGMLGGQAGQLGQHGGQLGQLGQIGGMVGQIGGQLGNGPSTGDNGKGATPLLPMIPGAPRIVALAYSSKEKILVLKRRNQDDFKVPYRLHDDTLTLDGQVLEIGGEGARPGYFQAELKGEWKRVNSTQRKKRDGI